MSSSTRITMAALVLGSMAALALLWTPSPVDAQDLDASGADTVRHLSDLASPEAPAVTPAGVAADREGVPHISVEQLQAVIRSRGLSRPERERALRLVDDLDAVASPVLVLPGFDPPFLAAEGDPAPLDPAEEAADADPAMESEGEPAPLEVSEAEALEEEAPVAPQPPAPRVSDPRRSSDSNTAIASMQHTLARGDAAGQDVLAARGVSDAVPGASRAPGGDPMNQPVNVDFRELQLSSAIALLAHKGGINIIAGTDLDTPVTMYLRGVPLRQAIRTILRSKGLGLLEQEGIYHVVPYEEAIAAERMTIMIPLENAKAADLATVVTDIAKGTPEGNMTNVSTNEGANILVINGPKEKLAELEQMVHELDVAEQVLPTVTDAIKLNYAEGSMLVPMVEKILTPEVGNVAADERARHLVVTDVPVVIAQVRQLVEQLDIPVKQVTIDAMVVDAVLNDGADTGVDWLLQTLRSQSRRQAALGDAGTFKGNLQQLDMGTDLNVGDVAGLLSFGVLTDNFDWRGIIQAEVRNSDSRLLSNPRLRTIENKPATITISQEIPYVELTETAQGGSQTSTSFKDIGTTLEVTPRVTHDNHVIVDIMGKESGTQGEFNNIPIEDKRQIETTARMMSGQTIYIGGLRKNDEDTTIRKVPVLGNVPVVNFLFRSNSRNEVASELLIFLTCTVVEEDAPLGPYESAKHQEGLDEDFVINAEKTVLDSIVHPNKPRVRIGK